MITPLPGWPFQVASDSVVRLVSPHGGRISYVERRRPMLPALSILETTPAFRPLDLLGAEMLVTDEGEYGSLATCTGRLDGREVVRVVACVYGDDFAAVLDGIADEPTHFPRVASAVRQMAVGDRLRLGVRQRRFLYRPPASWSVARDGLFHERLTPDDATRDAWIRVFPALPSACDDGTDEILDAARAGGGFEPHEVLGPFLVTARVSRLCGQRWDILGAARRGARMRQLVVLRDDRYLYPLCLDTALHSVATSRAAFDAVVGAVNAIPRGRATGHRPPEVATHWME